MDNQRAVGSSVARMKLSEPGRQIRSSPATNGMRAEPPSQAEPMPAMEILSMRAKASDDPAYADPFRHLAHRLHDALQTR